MTDKEGPKLTIKMICASVNETTAYVYQILLTHLSLVPSTVVIKHCS